MRSSPLNTHIALIDEPLCIGCTLCIRACPENAISGKRRQVHHIDTDLCTGCALCLPPCPIDCIRIGVREAEVLPATIRAAQFNAPPEVRAVRTVRASESTSHLQIPDAKTKQDLLAAAQARARARRHAQASDTTSSSLMAEPTP